jgi:hypothetical protein
MICCLIIALFLIAPNSAAAQLGAEVATYGTGARA